MLRNVENTAKGFLGGWGEREDAFVSLEGGHERKPLGEVTHGVVQKMHNQECRGESLGMVACGSPVAMNETK